MDKLEVYASAKGRSVLMVPLGVRRRVAMLLVVCLAIALSLCLRDASRSHRDLFDDFDPESLQCWDVRGSRNEQPDAMDAKVR
ncbi:hypothetical protein SAMN05443244_0114 [Terriglobus roseus]|uniref:Transmembrane protein n=1 Tax=Terriglobus roseus TaxID=392734 RepID=A0A1H4IXA5_9BACT|nr:hypothetical protein SAMN05443244_0114 [Terriglobus roseus]